MRINQQKWIFKEPKIILQVNKIKLFNNADRYSRTPKARDIIFMVKKTKEQH